MDRLGQFRILGKIGAGGMGEVYRARDEKLQRDVAIKIVAESEFADATSRARLLREARSAAGLNHPNICVVHEVGESEGKTFIAMECIDGESLSSRIARSPLSTQEVVRFGLQLADALAHAHERGVVHRDLKPANIVVTPEQRLKVLDFGLAKRALESDAANADDATDVLVTARGAITGTPAYMAPEQLRGLAADARSDIWAMGVILHEMITRKRPFAGNTMPELSAAILASPPQPLPEGTPPEIAAIIGHCLEKEPANRYRSAAEVRSALEIVLTGTISGRHQLALQPPPGRRTLFAAGAATLAIVAAVAVYVSRRDAHPASPTVAASAVPGATALPSAPVRTVAVLPFANFSGPDEGYLAEGMQDAINVELARVENLRVISRTTTMALQGAGKGAAEIAKELGTDDLIEGSVQSAGNRVRVQVKLIRAVPEERQVWAQAFERDLSDVFSLYNEIAAAVVTHIDPRLIAGIPEPSTARKVDPDLYKLYLKGRFFVAQGGKENIEKGIALFRQANEIDPTDALPYAGIAIGYGGLAHSPEGTPEVLDIARGAAKKALSIDPKLGDVYAAMALLKQYHDWEWTALENDFRQALASNPSDTLMRYHYAWFLMLHKRPDEAIAQVRRAREYAPLVSTYYSDLGWYYQILGRYDEALREARKGVELGPQDANAFYVLSIVHLRLRNYDEAVAAARRVLELDPPWRWPLAQALCAAGRDAEAQPLIDAMKKAGDSGSALGLGHVYAMKGDKDEAFLWLEKARELRAVWAPFMGVFAESEPLRGDPRMTKYLTTIGVPDVEPGWGKPKQKT